MEVPVQWTVKADSEVARAESQRERDELKVVGN
jgi:hypothetical protein